MIKYLNIKKIEKAKQQLEVEKQELLFIKEQLEDSTPKVDISKIKDYIAQLDQIFKKFMEEIGKELEKKQMDINLL